MSTDFLYFVVTVFVHHHFTVLRGGRRGGGRGGEKGGRRMGGRKEEGKREDKGRRWERREGSVRVY